MGLRRLSGLLLMLATTNFVAASDPACEMHAAGHNVAVESHASGMEHHAGEAPEKAPCSSPARSDCCPAVASCAPSALAAAGTAGIEAPGTRQARPSSTDGALLTRLIPPDPPPPKVQATHD